MQIRQLTPDHAVSPQITPQDIPAIKAAGFTTIICNRPDSEIPAELAAHVLREAAEAEGLAFVENQAAHPMTLAMAAAQEAALEAAEGPVLAYCASGNRCSILWALSMAGKMPVDEILGATLAAGYDQSALRADLEALATRRTA